MTAPVLPLRPRRTASDPLARLLDLETEVAELLAQSRRVGRRLNELEAERAELEAQVATVLDRRDLERCSIDELEKLAATVAAEQERLAQVQQQIAAARERKGLEGQK